jgi:hypothetical protein
MKVIGERHSDHSVELDLEAQGGSAVDLPLRLNGIQNKQVTIEGGELRPTVWAAIAPRALQWWAEGGSMVSGTNSIRSLHVLFPAGSGYQRQAVRITW